MKDAEALADAFWAAALFFENQISQAQDWSDCIPYATHMVSNSSITR